MVRTVIGCEQFWNCALLTREFSLVLTTKYWLTPYGIQHIHARWSSELETWIQNFHVRQLAGVCTDARCYLFITHHLINNNMKAKVATCSFFGIILHHHTLTVCHFHLGTPDIFENNGSLVHPKRWRWKRNCISRLHYVGLRERFDLYSNIETLSGFTLHLVHGLRISMWWISVQRIVVWDWHSIMLAFTLV